MVGNGILANAVAMQQINGLFDAKCATITFVKTE